MELSQAISHAVYGDAVLFLGSGFSIQAEKENGSVFQDASSLAKSLMREIGYNEKELLDDLGDASQLFLNEKGPEALVDFIRNEFVAVEAKNHHKAIAGLPWQRVYTTNYDNVYELAAQNIHRPMTSVVLSDRIKDNRKKDRVVVHINGYAGRLTLDKLDTEFKLTNRSYLTDDFNRSEWKNLFISDLKTAKAIFFVGYSMRYDLDIKRTIVNLDPSLKEKTFFIVKPDESKAAKDLISGFGHCEPIGTIEFAEMLAETVENQVPRPVPDFSPLCFKKVSQPRNATPITGSDVFSLLFTGNIDTTKLYFSLESPEIYPYSFVREKQHEIIQTLLNGENNILIHSDLGNGKTVLVEGLSMLLAKTGYEVYCFQTVTPTLAKEIEHICPFPDPTVFIFDGYYSNMEALKELKLHRTNQIVILTERSAANDFGYEELADLLGDFRLFNINRLERKEIADFSKLLSRHGHWGDKAALTQTEKIEYISKENKAQIKNVILSRFKSEHIIRKFEQLIEGLKNKEGYYNAVIFMLFASLANIRLELEDLAYCMEIDRINTPTFKKDRTIGEFVDFNGGEFRLKSSILSKVLLNRITDTSIVTDVLTSVFARVHDHRSSAKSRKILKSLMVFSNIQNALCQDNNNRYNANVNSYYDTLKTFEFCRDNEQFWLQYAIVKLSQSRFDEAESYFKTAYGLAKRQNQYDTYKIDNHYAKYLLMNAISNVSPETFMTSFRKAHGLLMQESPMDHGMSYPLTVAKYYKPFIKKYLPQMTLDDKVFVQTACYEMIDRMERFISEKDPGKHKDEVRRACQALKEATACIANS